MAISNHLRVSRSNPSADSFGRALALACSGPQIIENTKTGLPWGAVGLHFMDVPVFFYDFGTHIRQDISFLKTMEVSLGLFGSP